MRLKNHIKDPETGEPLFRTRQVTPRAVVFSATEQPEFTAFQQALLAAVAPRLRQAVRQRRFGEVLAFVSLLKRSVSTVAACRNTLANFLPEDATRRKSSIGTMLTRAVATHITGRMDDQPTLQ